MVSPVPLISYALFLAFFPSFCRALPNLGPVSLQSRDVTNSSKAGLAWPNGQWIDMTQYESTGKVSWYYTWSPSVVSTANIEFVPQLWGTDQIDEWQSDINSTISHYSIKAVLGFNEPELSSQSNLGASEGASLWQQYIEPLKSQGIRLGSPAPSSSPTGKTWLQDWLGNCTGGCNPDFIALHWYDVNATAFIEYLEDFHDTFGLDLWVTEWACQNFNGGSQCSQDEVDDFLNVTQSYTDSSSFVERYAWFGAMENLQGVNSDNALMDSSGNITALGEQYIGSTGEVSSAVPRLSLPHFFIVSFVWTVGTVAVLAMFV